MGAIGRQELGSNLINELNGTQTNITDLNDNLDVVGTTLTEITTNVDIIRIAKTDTGVSDAYIIDTEGTFNQTITGNLISWIPTNNNTGACTVAFDDQTALNIKSVDDTGTKVDTEADTIKAGQMVTGYVDVANGFFVLAPKGGGSNIKSIQRGSTAIDTTTKLVTITSIDTAQAVLIISTKPKTTSDDSRRAFAKGKIVDSTTIQFDVPFPDGTTVVYWQIIEFNNVKSIQNGDLTLTAGSGSINTTVNISSIDPLKSIIYHSYTQNVGSAVDGYLLNVASTINSATQISFIRGNVAGGFTISWQVIEFN